LTPNTVIQGAWALSLSSHAVRDDVVFGVVVSGRSAEVTDIDSMVGLFINTLPTRAKITPEAELIDWLKQLQAQQVEMGQYEYSPLAQVQTWSAVEPGKPLFESIFLFENYPVSVADSGVRVGSIRSLERSNYPLTVWAIPNKELVLRIGYNTRCFDDSSINKLLQEYLTLLETIALADEKGEALCLKSLLATKKHKMLKMGC
jgi:non-ribosomal peptide synthetase component F